MIEEYLHVLSQLGAAANPLIALAVAWLGWQWTKFNTSLTMLARSVEQLSSRIERLEGLQMRGPKDE